MFQEHVLLILAGGPDAYNCATITMVVVSEVSEHPSGDVKRRDAMRDLLPGLGQGKAEFAQSLNDEVRVFRKHL